LTDGASRRCGAGRAATRSSPGRRRWVDVVACGCGGRSAFAIMRRRSRRSGSTQSGSCGLPGQRQATRFSASCPTGVMNWADGGCPTRGKRSRKWRKSRDRAATRSAPGLPIPGRRLLCGRRANRSAATRSGPGPSGPAGRTRVNRAWAGRAGPSAGVMVCGGSAKLTLAPKPAKSSAGHRPRINMDARGRGTDHTATRSSPGHRPQINIDARGHAADHTATRSGRGSRRPVGVIA
jgi:hypothetical protein